MSRHVLREVIPVNHFRNVQIAALSRCEKVGVREQGMGRSPGFGGLPQRLKVPKHVQLMGATSEELAASVPSRGSFSPRILPVAMLRGECNLVPDERVQLYF